MFSSCVLCRGSGFSRNSAPFEVGGSFLAARGKQRFAHQIHCRSGDPARRRGELPPCGGPDRHSRPDAHRDGTISTQGRRSHCLSVTIRAGITPHRRAGCLGLAAMVVRGYPAASTHRSMRWKKTSATGSPTGTKTPNLSSDQDSSGPRPPTISSNASPHIFTEFLAQDATA